MTTYLKQKFKTNLASALAQSFASNSPDNYFVFLGKTSSWPDDENPPEAIDSHDEEVQAWQNMIALGKLTSKNVVLGCKRFNWTYNTLFDQYDSSLDLYEESNEKMFYCITDDLNVYKCLNNNYGSKSLYKPSSTSPEEEVKEDGYIWKFMFKIREEMIDFLTDDFIPVEFLTNIIYNDERNLQNDVRISSIPGSIENIVLTQIGGAYPLAIINDEINSNQKHKILEYAVDGDLTVHKLTPLVDMDRTNGIYNDYYELYIIEGGGAGQKSVILDYAVDATNSSDITVTLQDPLYGINAQSVFRIYPRIKITGDGVGASAIPILDNNKVITSIKIINSGKNYHYANIDIFRKNATYSNKTLARAIISPLFGHGFDAISELGSNMLLVNIPLSTRDEALLDDNLRNLLSNQYRQIGIIKNAYENISGIPYTLNLLGSDEEFNTAIEIENLNSTSTIVFTNTQTLNTSSFIDQIVSQGLDENPYQARGVIRSLTLSGSNYIMIVSNTNGAFLSNQESDFQLVVNDQTISTNVLAVNRQNIFTDATFNVNDSILGATTASTATVVSWTPNLYGLSGTLFVDNIKGKFQTSFYSKDDSGNIVLVKGENIVGYSDIDTSTGQLTTDLTKVGIIKTVYPEVNETKRFFKVTKTLNIQPISGSLSSDLFQNNDLIANGTDNTSSNYAEARVVSYTPPDSGSDSVTSAQLQINSLIGSFEPGDIIYFISGTNQTNASVESVVEPEVLLYYGDVIYIQNIRPVSTADDTLEQIKVLITF